VVVGGLPRSCLIVLDVLASSKYANGITQKELRNKTALAIRTIKYAIYNLKNKNLVYEKLILSDIRNKKYYLGGNYYEYSRYK